MRRWMKRIGIICLIPMVLVILISILLYIPPFQNFAVRLATEYASETTGMDRADTSFLPAESDDPGRESHNSSRHVIVTRKFPSQHPSAATAEKRSLGGCDRPARRESQYWQPDRGNGDQRYFRKALC